MANIDELLEQASEIRDANEEKENTALRVGTMLVDILQYIAGFIDRETLRQILQEYASLSGTGLVNWRQSRCVFLASMGTELDNIDGGKWEYTSHDGDIVFNPSSKTLRIVGETNSYFTAPGVIYVNAHTGHLYKWDLGTQKMTELVDSSSPTVIDYRNAPAFADIPIGATYYFLSQSSGYKIGVKVDAHNYCSFAIDPKKVYAFRDTRQTAVWNADTQTWTVLSSPQDGSEGSGGGSAGVSAFDNYEAYESINALPGQGVATTGYIVGTHIYAYVSSGGDTKDGKYQDLGELNAAGVSLTTNGDGTFTVHSGGNDYTVNLNHTHPNMAKLIVCEEGDLPSTLDNSTIYAITDSGETEIEKLIIRGMEFAGGGIPDTGEPMISSPSNGSTINLGTNEGSGVSKTITIKGKNLTGDLTVTVGTGLTISYGQSTGQSSVTIPMAQALLGAQVTIAYSSSGALDDGSLVITHGNDVLSSVVVVVVVVAELPNGYTRLEYVDNAVRGIDTGILATDSQDTSQSVAGSSWEVDVQCNSAPASNEMIVVANEDVAHWFGAVASTGCFGSGGADYCFSSPATTRQQIQVAFFSNKIVLTSGGETKTRNYTYQNKRNVCLLNNINASDQQYAGLQFTGKVYSIKCTSGGSFDAVPAQRTSDGKKGLYDKANDVFYPLTT